MNSTAEARTRNWSYNELVLYRDEFPDKIRWRRSSLYQDDLPTITNLIVRLVDRFEICIHPILDNLKCPITSLFLNSYTLKLHKFLNPLYSRVHNSFVRSSTWLLKPLNTTLTYTLKMKLVKMLHILIKNDGVFSYFEC